MRGISVNKVLEGVSLFFLIIIESIFSKYEEREIIQYFIFNDWSTINNIQINVGINKV